MKYVFYLVIFLFFSAVQFGHCQIPCGIYDDERVFSELYEHVDTIHKAVDVLSVSPNLEDPLAMQQFVRWVTNKDDHASKIQSIMTDYFLSQRLSGAIKTNTFNRAYHNKLKSIHLIIFNSMKAKQTVSLDVVESLNQSIKSFESLYFSK